MKKHLKVIIVFLLIVLFGLGIYNVVSIYNMKIVTDNMDCTIINKNMKNGVSLEIDNSNNIYVAKRTQIKLITPEGKEKNVISNGNYDIEDILYNDNKLYFISKTTLYKLDLENLDIEDYLENIPLSGNNVDRKLFLVNGNMGLAIGACTNSGVSEGPNFEIPPIDITLNGNNFGDSEDITYCKRPGIKGIVGEKIDGQSIGNAAIYLIDKDTKKLELYASGIRAITGIDVNSQGEIYAAVQGMSNEGLRPINDDCDYIYEIKKGIWYGFPDYSGGDYIESPRFQDNEGNLVKPILLLESKTSEKANAPLFVSDKQNTIKSCAIDKDGNIFEKDSIVFFDKSSKKIKVLSKTGSLNDIVTVTNKSDIKDIVYYNKGFYIMDSYLGYIYKISQKENPRNFYIPRNIWIFITLLSAILIIIAIYKLLKTISK
ncbi:MAG: hypothetical protein PUD42_03655 [Clostridiales bacterium]|nr:hypothetical protein [Clostridiales bacterium]